MKAIFFDNPISEIKKLDHFTNDDISKKLEAIEKNIRQLNLSTYTPIDPKDETAPTSKRISFVIYAITLGFFETIGGVASMYTFIEYLCTNLSIHLITPVAGICSLLFGLINASVASVFDIYAVAEAMEVPYLTACKELKSLINQSYQLIELNRYLKKSFNMLSKKINEGITLEKDRKQFNILENQLTEIQKIQPYVTNRINQYEEKITLTKKKRKFYQFIWVLFASPIYAGTIVIGANAALAILPTFGIPPAGLAIAATFALIWVLVELYRFWSFERRHMVLGIDSFIFGSPEDKITKMTDNKEKMTKKLNRNKEVYDEIKSQLESKSKNISLQAENDRLKNMISEKETIEFVA